MQIYNYINYKYLSSYLFLVWKRMYWAGLLVTVHYCTWISTAGTVALRETQRRESLGMLAPSELLDTVVVTRLLSPRKKGRVLFFVFFWHSKDFCEKLKCSHRNVSLQPSESWSYISWKKEIRTKDGCIYASTSQSNGNDWCKCYIQVLTCRKKHSKKSKYCMSASRLYLLLRYCHL